MILILILILMMMMMMMVRGGGGLVGNQGQGQKQEYGQQVVGGGEGREGSWEDMTALNALIQVLVTIAKALLNHQNHRQAHPFEGVFYRQNRWYPLHGKHGDPNKDRKRLPPCLPVHPAEHLGVCVSIADRWVNESMSYHKS